MGRWQKWMAILHLGRPKAEQWPRRPIPQPYGFGPLVRATQHISHREEHGVFDGLSWIRPLHARYGSRPDPGNSIPEYRFIFGNALGFNVLDRTCISKRQDAGIWVWHYRKRVSPDQIQGMHAWQIFAIVWRRTLKFKNSRVGAYESFTKIVSRALGCPPDSGEGP